ncbi:hypothetical protein HG263_20770 [Pseudoalteromonas sp. JBTF-M23]|uniref:Uncharacterized protein n=1 Tax=Pseudoalteromonas caenipelagi TaxID=2726988 RepID=A0A849VJX2_9GAMM|nr:hypothetical protein [Pseudoalteromonas caenipelagi]NOU52938.1 hypothetical protein [Pseudoalteromonas caenipelagi]
MKQQMQLRLSKRAHTVRFNNIQPLFENVYSPSEGRVGHALLPDYGLLNLSEFMRELSFLGMTIGLRFVMNLSTFMTKYLLVVGANKSAE